MTFSVQPIVSPTDIANSIGSVVAVGTIRADEGVNMSVSTPAGVERLPLTDGDSQVSLDVSLLHHATTSNPMTWSDRGLHRSDQRGLCAPP